MKEDEIGGARGTYRWDVHINGLDENSEELRFWDSSEDQKVVEQRMIVSVK
jgi:hypothetical protein